MSFLPAKDVVNAVVESTDEYLRFLTEQRLGRDKYHATNIRRTEAEDSFFENSRWQIYACHLPPHQRVREDSSATFISHATPGSEMEIRVLTYDRRTGRTTFASREPVVGEGGDVIVDFRWLVRRCREWFQQRGTSVAEISEIMASVSNKEVSLARPERLTDQQLRAIDKALTTGLSYIWGPPGTGKTTWVLAKAVHHCVGQGEKVLVLASTNLAVDNALVAILNEGTPKERVLRIGIPSEGFRTNFPECCEARAFQEEARRIGSEIKDAENVVASIERLCQLEGQLGDVLPALESARKGMDESRRRLQEVKETLEHAKDVYAQLQQMLRGFEDTGKAKQAELAGLAFPQLVAEVEALETEQAQTIVRKNEFHTRIDRLGWIERVFTGKKATLTKSIAVEQRHLEAIEATLASKRQKRDQLAPRVAGLKREVADLRSQYATANQKVTEQQTQIRTLETEESRLRNTIAEDERPLYQLENLVEDIRTKISDVRDRYPADQRDELMAASRLRIDQLKKQLDQFQQDLSRKAVLGMTLDGFIGLTLQMSIHVDRVFVDEAPYAPLAKVLPLLCLHRPIAMLGDHCQLPPICEDNANATIRAYWAKPAIFLEDAFRFGSNWEELDGLAEPQLKQTHRAVLTKSYRFGQKLAELLDRHVYGYIGLTGLGRTDTTIDCIHCEARERAGRERRQNDAEADEIVAYVEEWCRCANQRPDEGDLTIAVLTPYRKQAKLIRDKLMAASLLDRVEVWNTHQAQGREWDWVLFSASDTGKLEGNDPWFSDSGNPVGRALLNTTISRTKQNLSIFLDANYWKERRVPSILTELVRDHV